MGENKKNKKTSIKLFALRCSDFWIDMTCRWSGMGYMELIYYTLKLVFNFFMFDKAL